jgi:hypothetical protein
MFRKEREEESRQERERWVKRERGGVLLLNYR